MAKWVKMAFFLSALFLVNGVTWFVTTANQKAGLYPIDADSIGIPIMFTIAACVLMLPILFIISMLPNKRLLNWLNSKGLVRLMIARIGVLSLYALVFLFAAYGFVYWNSPGHYFIAASYLIFIIILLIYLLIDWREINKGLKG